MLEIIVETVADALAAEAGGATQLDLKSAAELDGLTPTLGMIEQICSRVQIDVMVMVRPHKKSFVLSPEDIAAMCKDISLARQYNVAGFLLGALTPQGEIDVEAVQKFREAAAGIPLNFHLAWEQTKDPEQALEKLIELGIKSVRLTGGRRLGTKAPDGTERIRRFQNQADGRIDLFLAGGVTPENIAWLVQETGVPNAHSGSGVRMPAESGGDVVEARVRLLRENLDRAVRLHCQS